MKSSMKVSAAAVVLVVASCFPVLAQQGGAALYNQDCASCHDAGGDQQSRVPSRSALQSMSFEHVLRTITSGSMAEMAKGRTDDERKAIASFVTGRISNNPVPTATDEHSATCAKHPHTFAGALDGPRWNGWGVDPTNSRFQSAEMARLTPDQLPKLRLKWAFGIPGGT